VTIGESHEVGTGTAAFGGAAAGLAAGAAGAAAGFGGVAGAAAAGFGGVAGAAGAEGAVFVSD